MKRGFPHLPVLGTLLLAWLALFHFLGNSSFGYINTPSLFAWLRAVYAANTDDALGYAIPPLIVLLIWSRREEFGAVPKRPWLPAVALLALAMAGHAAGYLVQQARLSLVGLCLGLYALTGVVWGPKWLRSAAYPFALLIFTVPLTAYTDSLTFPLRLLATQVASGFCTGVLGLDLFRKGTEVFHALPDGTTGFQFDVAPACSGIRSLTVVLLLTLVFGYLNLRSTPRRLVLALAAVPLALLGNVVRLVVVFYVGAQYGQEAGLRIETKLGFLTFLVALGGVMLLARWLREPAADGGTIVAEPPAELQQAGKAPWAAALGLVALIIGVGALAVRQISTRQRLGRPAVALSRIPLIGDEGRLVRSNSVALPTLIPGYSYQPVPVTDLELNYLPPDTTYGRGRYLGSDGFWAQVNVVLMGTDRTSIHRPEYCLTGQGWKILHKREASVSLKRGNETVELPVQRFDGKLSTVVDGRPMEVGGVYVFWFVADGLRTASHWQRQWWMIRDLVTRGELQRWAYVSFFAPCPPGKEDETFERLTGLISATSPYFELTDEVASR